MIGATRAHAYQPQDQLYLWWLANPAIPVFIGELAMVRTSRGVSLTYGDSWIEQGFALSEDLPLLLRHEFLPREKDTAAGAVDDARPDRWGERVIRFLDKPPRLSLLDILLDNTDDHEKNHVLLVTDTAQYELSPAFDVLPSGQALGYQQMRVGSNEADATLDNALSMCNQFSLKPADARRQIATVAQVIDGWHAFFSQSGVTSGDIALLAEQIDRPFLRDQRTQAMAW